MRIGFDATSLPRQPVGAGNYIIHIIRALLQEDAADEFVVFVQKSRLELLGLKPAKNLSLIIQPDRVLWQRLVWEQVTLPRLVSRLGIDLLHSPHYTMPLMGTCNSVVTFHDMSFFLYPQLHTYIKRYFFQVMIYLSVKRAAGLIAVSESTRRDTCQLLNTPADKIHTVLCGVSREFCKLSNVDEFIRVNLQYGLPERFILFVGLLEPRKNIPVLLRAFKRISSCFPHVRLVIVGRPGWAYQEIRREISRQDMNNFVYFTGYISQNDLPLIYNRAEFLVYPSLYEGFGFPVIEAMACGTPVITTQVASLLEIAEGAAWLVPPGDEVSLAHGLATLLMDDSLRESLSQRGIERAAEFTWQRAARQTMQVYRRLLKQ